MIASSSSSQGQVCGMVMFRGQITKYEHSIILLSYITWSQMYRDGCVFWCQLADVNCGGDGRGQSNSCSTRKVFFSSPSKMGCL